LPLPLLLLVILSKAKDLLLLFFPSSTTLRVPHGQVFVRAVVPPSWVPTVPCPGHLTP
jgi:hypothetical protein